MILLCQFHWYFYARLTDIPIDVQLGMLEIDIVDISMDNFKSDIFTDVLLIVLWTSYWYM